MYTEQEIWSRWLGALHENFPALWSRLIAGGQTLETLQLSKPRMHFIGRHSLNEDEYETVKIHWYNFQHRLTHQKTSISVTRDTKTVLQRLQKEMALTSLEQVIQELVPLSEDVVFTKLSTTRPDESALNQLKSRLSVSERRLIMQMLAWTYSLGVKVPVETSKDENLTAFKGTSAFKVWRKGL